jgi:excisionase family DNA binding protein
MFILNKDVSTIPEFDGVLNEKLLTISAASKITGYNSQYLRRLLRNGKLTGIRVGQTWLIKLISLANYLTFMSDADDRRCGAKKPPRINGFQ